MWYEPFSIYFVFFLFIYYYVYSLIDFVERVYEVCTATHRCIFTKRIGALCLVLINLIMGNDLLCVCVYREICVRPFFHVFIPSQ